MRPLSDALLLQAWEVGMVQHPVDRALMLLVLGYPEKSVETLIGLSVGQRDAHLLELRRVTFGPQLEVLTTCSQCSERLELTLQVNDLLLVEIDQPQPESINLALNGYDLQLRLPTSEDLAAIVGIEDVNVARKVLEQRCLIAASRSDQPVAYEALPEDAIALLRQQLAEADPQAEMLFDLICPACQHEWQTLFDIVSFFWTEIGAQARRLLQEVHILAKFYGWRESDILAMGNFRRRQYLELME